MKKNIFSGIFDSDAEPYIEQKNVILCRSGIQLYHKSELQAFMSDGNRPPVEKEWYREYRPANVVVKAKKLCASLPVSKEHPSEWITPDNWTELAGGTTDKQVEVVALDGESEGEIGLESTITFYDRDLYEYYRENNKEVSLGYQCSKHWVSNPEEVGYDIILDEITEVNHLAITRAGRGGSSVAVIDSIIGGLKPMRTGIFAFLKGKNKTSDSALTFGALVFDSLKKSKGSTEEELASDMKAVLDSCAELKDCETKTTMLNAVRDCFDNKEKALANEEELVKALDSMHENITKDSVEEIDSACCNSSEEKTEDACGKDEKCPVCGEEKDSKENNKEDETKDSEEKSKEDEEKDSAEKDEKCPVCGEEKDSEAQKDSAPVLDSAMEALVRKLVAEEVKSVLGVSKDLNIEVKGSALDSETIGS